MTILKASTTIAGAAVICRAVGAAIGFCLGEYVPGSLRSQFPHGIDPRFDPVEVGIGLGCAQGLIAGVALGIVVVLAVTWYEVRMAEMRMRDRP